MDTMRSVEITGERRASIVEHPVPRAVGEFAIVEIAVSPMCTEATSYASGHMFHPLGHEAAGEVVDMAQKGTVAPGDRVVVMPQYPCGKCRLCLSGDYIHCLRNYDMTEVLGSEWGIDTYAQYVVKQDWLLVPIPDDMSYEHGSMACCGLGPSFGGMDLCGVDGFDTVLITGLGPVGLGGVINGVARGARVIGVESNTHRADLARELGADAVIDPKDPDAQDQILSLTGGSGVDKALDCSGVGAAVVFCIQATRRKGQVALVGGSGDFTVNGWGDIVSKGLTIHGAWHWNFGAVDRIFQVIRRHGDLIDKQITHKYPLEKVADAWDLQLTGNCGKVLLYPWE
jgi:L-iditol 2-dehydrogenase